MRVIGGDDFVIFQRLEIPGKVLGLQFDIAGVRGRCNSKEIHTANRRSITRESPDAHSLQAYRPSCGLGDISQKRLDIDCLEFRSMSNGDQSGLLAHEALPGCAQCVFRFESRAGHFVEGAAQIGEFVL